MSAYFKKAEQILEKSNNTLIETLGIKFIQLSPDSVTGYMPVVAKVRQPLGYLHGGATVAFAETLTSVGAYLNVESPYYPLGMEINANHLASLIEGYLYGVATPLHRGEKTQVWNCSIYGKSLQNPQSSVEQIIETINSEPFLQLINSAHNTLTETALREAGIKKICVSRCTLMIVSKKEESTKKKLI
jgi:1,4-dihydroxy-2-naphthoyl-CoA hydrolase